MENLVKSSEVYGFVVKNPIQIIGIEILHTFGLVSLPIQLEKESKSSRTDK